MRRKMQWVERNRRGDPGRFRQRSLSSFQYHSFLLFEGLTEKKECEVNAKGREGEINRDFRAKGGREGAIKANTNKGNGSKELKKINIKK